MAENSGEHKPLTRLSWLAIGDETIALMPGVLTYNVAVEGSGDDMAMRAHLITATPEEQGATVSYSVTGGGMMVEDIDGYRLYVLNSGTGVLTITVSGEGRESAYVINVTVTPT